MLKSSTNKKKKENISVIEAKTENGLENPRTGYSQRIVHVDTEKNIILKDEIYRQGRLIKIFEVVQLEKVDGFWTVVEAKMDNLVEGGSTRLIRKNTQYNQKLKDRLFNQRTLRKGLD